MVNASSVLAIEPRAPIINSVPQALDDVGCAFERLQATLDANIGEFNDAFVDNDGLAEHLQRRASSIWLVFLLASESLQRLHQTTNAVCSKAYAERLEQVA